MSSGQGPDQWVALAIAYAPVANTLLKAALDALKNAANRRRRPPGPPLVE
jgi:hypothetical protein